jgi:maleate cis-trans isomerase
MSNSLEVLYGDEAIKDFGSALRKSLRIEEIQDYASLIEIENAEKEEDFADAIRKFLRRYESHASRMHLKRPTEESLEKLMKLISENGVRLVRAALISHALVKGTREEE